MLYAQRIDELYAEIERMERNNDGSLKWVDDIRDVYIEIDRLYNLQLDAMDLEPAEFEDDFGYHDGFYEEDEVM